MSRRSGLRAGHGRFPAPLRLVLPVVLAALLSFPAPAAAEVGSGGSNAPAHLDTPSVVMISIDGYRWDYPDRFPTPAIMRLAGNGVRAERLVPVWPTLTFPNHYSLVTGLAPATHGIVGNEFPEGERWYAIRDRAAVEDGRWYAGEPLWVSAERQGMVTASFYWVGSEAAIGGLRPTHWRRFDDEVADRERVEQVLAWLREPRATRPRFITLYFEDVDSTAHWYGVGSPEFRAALDGIDAALMRLLDGVDALPHGDEVYLLLVSDHGHMAYADEPPLVLEEYLYLDGLALIDKGAAVYAWQGTRDPEAARKIAETINAVWANGRAWTRATAPASWGLADSGRMPDIVFQADPGHAVISRPERARTITAANHGWAPETPEMHGVFIARGPGLEAGGRRGPVHVLEVYPMVADWLGLERPATGAATSAARPDPDGGP